MSPSARRKLFRFPRLAAVSRRGRLFAKEPEIDSFSSLWEICVGAGFSWAMKKSVGAILSRLAHSSFDDGIDEEDRRELMILGLMWCFGLMIGRGNFLSWWILNETISGGNSKSLKYVTIAPFDLLIISSTNLSILNVRGWQTHLNSKTSINKLEHVPQNIICQHPKLLCSRKIHSKYLENISVKRYRFIAENIKSVIAMATFLRALLSTSTMATSPRPPERFPFILLCRSSSNHHISSFNLALFILLSGFAFSTAMGESEMRIKIMRAIIQPPNCYGDCALCEMPLLLFRSS